MTNYRKEWPRSADKGMQTWVQYCMFMLPSCTRRFLSYCYWLLARDADADRRVRAALGFFWAKEVEAFYSKVSTKASAAAVQVIIFSRMSAPVPLSAGNSGVTIWCDRADSHAEGSRLLGANFDIYSFFCLPVGNAQ
jgi:hypothetical protein